MIRPFDWRDVGLVKTLSEQGLCLASETALTHGTHPLQNALLDYLMPGAGTPTWIWRDPDASGPAVFGQLQHRLGRKYARVLFIAPHLAALPSDVSWVEVVERLAQAAGERGAHNLLAEVSEENAEFEALRHAGFAIYSRQSVWKLPLGRVPPAPTAEVDLRPAASVDQLGISTLYSNIVPRLVQQVEPLPRRIETGYVLQKHNEIIAFLDIRRGPLGIWVKPYLHPEAYDLSEAVLQSGVSQISARSEKPIFVCVPRYQDWLQTIVTQSGFEALGAQAVMVKRLTARVAEPMLKPLPVVEGQATPATQARLHPPYEEPLTDGVLAYWLSHHAKTNHRRSPRSPERHSTSSGRRLTNRQSHR
jgi:hypothetical protein